MHGGLHLQPVHVHVHLHRVPSTQPDSRDYRLQMEASIGAHDALQDRRGTVDAYDAGLWPTHERLGAPE